MLAQARADQMQQRTAAAAAAGPSSSRTAALASEQDQGYWQYMQKQLNERTQKLGSVNDGMDSLEQTTSTWLGDVNKFVNQQKKNAVTGSKSPPKESLVALVLCLICREDMLTVYFQSSSPNSDSREEEKKEEMRTSFG